MDRLCLMVVCAGAVFGSPTPRDHQLETLAQIPAIQRFREYLRIDTSRQENIHEAVEFFRRQAAEIGLPMVVYEPAGKPICVITWPGTNPALPSIMLNSHMDVVATEDDYWNYPPFEAHMDENGDIFGRGTQDTKDIAIQYLEAIRILIQQNVTLERTVHITFMPDEESGGFYGMKPFIKTKEFEDLNIGFALDEGLSSVDDSLLVTFQDKRPWQMKFTVKGEGGHGGTIPDGTAMEKATRLVEAVTKHRNKQKKVMKSTSATDFGAYDSLNVNIIQGGIAPNIIPSEVTVVVDLRLSTKAKPSDVMKMIQSWIAASGNGTQLEFFRRDEVSLATAVDNSNLYWLIMKSAAADLGMSISPIVCPATSDMLVLRGLGIPAFGFAPKTHTISRIHGSNEYLNAYTFLKGIDIYLKVIEKLGNIL